MAWGDGGMAAERAKSRSPFTGKMLRPPGESLRLRLDDLRLDLNYDSNQWIHGWGHDELQYYTKDNAEIRWYVDGRLYSTKRFWWSSSKRGENGGLKPESEAELNPWPAPFDRPFHLVLNLAVGGRFPGNPDGTTAFPAALEIDYVRLYERPGGDGEVSPRGEGALPFGR